MSLAERVQINGRYTRAVSLERDIGAVRDEGLYIPTSRALQTLTRVATGLGTAAVPRAWALIGPYGSGKSAFGVFLANLLGNDDYEACQKARQRLRAVEPSLVRAIEVQADSGAGYCTVVLTGSPEPLSKRLVAALAQAARGYWSGRRGRQPAILTELNACAEASNTPGASDIVALIDGLAKAVAKAGGDGVLILIDELGKFLEYESRHYGANDIYLLQAIAEFTCRTGHERVLLITMLHQAIEQYARGLGERQRNEWLKVQGRFELLPFIDSSEQVLRIVDAAFDIDLKAREKTQLRKGLAPVVETLVHVGALPKELSIDAAKKLFLECYPLHPVTALLLPALCQKIAQNERTLFSYLGSREPGGFRDTLAHLETVGEFVGPWDVYDYFIENQPAALTDSATQRRWSEIVTALERLEDAPLASVRLLKTIGILNLAGAHSGLKASPHVLAACFPDDIATGEVAKSLEAASAIQFRRFSGEWRVWQGSDIDLGIALDEAREQLGHFELADAINRRRSFQPIVTRRHSIESGTLRYFQPVLVGRNEWEGGAAVDERSHAFFFLAEGADDWDYFDERVRPDLNDTDVAAFQPNAQELREVVGEVLALERVLESHQELQADAVALREVRDRLTEASRHEAAIIQSLLLSPQDAKWFWRGEQLAVESRRDLQRELSNVMDRVYHASPVIRNELINRDKVSSQAAAARNKLLAALLKSLQQADLGIEKFPPEKAIYRSLLRATGLHRQTDDGWRLFAPAAEYDPRNLLPVWEVMTDYFLGATEERKSFEALDTQLRRAPYGVKEGVLPILHVCALLYHDRDVALFEDGRYVPQITPEHLERFVRRRGDFSVQSFRIQGLRASLFSEYARILVGKNAETQTVVDLARPLARFMADLPECVKTTTRISPAALRVRAAFNAAKSPEALLFETLPEACGLPPQGEAEIDADALEQFAETLIGVLRELNTYLRNLLADYTGQMCSALGLEPTADLSEARRLIAGRCAGLHEYTMDADGLRAWLLRLSDGRSADDAWLRSTLTFLGRKPVERWLDNDRAAVDLRLVDYGRRVGELRRLQVENEAQIERLNPGDEVVLLRSVNRSRAPKDGLVIVEASARSNLSAIAEQVLLDIQASAASRDQQLAVLALLADRLLTPEAQGTPSTANVSVKETDDEA